MSGFIPKTGGGSGGGTDAQSIRGINVSVTPPSTGQLLQYNGSSYVPVTLTADDIAPAFAISSFSGGSITKEIGDTIASPVSFTASYSSLPTSAQIQDNQGNGALTLITPFTSGSYAHSYTKTANNATVVFTLTAIGATTKTSTNTAAWRPKLYYGVAAQPGIYNAAFLHSLASQPLSASKSLTVNYVAGASQYCYYCVPTSYGVPSATFNGFPFGATNVATVSDTNSFGVTQNYYVMESNLANLGTLTGVAWT